MPPTTVTTEFVAVAPDSSGIASAAVTPVLPVGATPHGRGIAVTILALIAVVAALEVAQMFFVSLLLGIIVAYTLNPLVAYLERIRIPRAVGAILVMAGVVGALGFGAYSLRGQVQSIIEQLPEATRTFSAAVARLRTMPGGNLQKVQNAAAEVEKATTQGAATAPTPRQAPTHVVVDQPGLKLNNLLFAGSLGALGALGQTITVLFLAFFLLLGGDMFRRKMVRLTGPTLSHKKITVQILDDINDSIQKYLFMLLATNTLVAILAWIALRWIGLENAGAWAVASGLLHVIPYFGPGVTAAVIAMATFMQFDSFSMAFLAFGVSLAIATFVGTFVTTWMTGRIAKMNAAAIFVSLLFWGWLWGIWGMLLGIPIVVICKVVSEHVEALQPVGELLGD